MSNTSQIESPDRFELLRTRCPACGHEVAVATWCHDPACCDQSPFGFLVEELATAQAARRGVPVFAVRYPDPLPLWSPDVPVRVWRAGSTMPAFEGRLEDAVSFEMRHDCPGSPAPGEREAGQ